jgi:type VI secretion system protein VasI
MRIPGLIFFSTISLAGAISSQVAGATTLRDCISIVSNMERLACFDMVVGTPPAPTSKASAVTKTPALNSGVRVPEIVTLAQDNEIKRKKGETGFKLLKAEDTVQDQTKIVLSAPAIDRSDIYFVVSCLSNISRLQLITSRPTAASRMNIRLHLDGRALSNARPWQVLEDGNIVDAGRGLVAIEQLRFLTAPGSRLQVESDNSEFNGLIFDASGLSQLMTEQRGACHW